MVKKNILVIADVKVEDQPILTLEELCHACQVSSDFIEEAVEYGVIELDEEDLESVQFGPDHLKRMRTAVRLYRDLEVNLAGIAIVLDLMDEIERLRMRVELFEKR